MTKLTTWLREAIVKDMMAYRFKGVFADLVKRAATLSDDVYKDVYDNATRAKMARLPDGWLPRHNEIGVQFARRDSTFVGLDFDGSWIRYENSGELNHIKPDKFVWKKDERLLAYRHKGSCVKQYDKGEPLCERYFALKNEATKIASQVYDARKLGMQGVNQATTIKRLIEVWPEVKPFASKYEEGPRQRPALPVPQLATLNAMFKLPVDGRATAAT